MRRNVLTAALLSGAIFISTSIHAQQADRSAYAITDATGQNANWSFLRKLDLNTGQYSQVLLDGNDVNTLAWDASSKKQMTTPLQDARYGQWANAAFGTAVAAAAYDKAHNRLYYTPMFIDQLRYIDLKTMKVFFVNGEAFTGKPQKSPDQGNIVTRMVIASDGNGYAITNDGMQLIRFSTGKKLLIEDLGQLVDDPANKGVSIHNSCSSYGGDVVADDDGNIYLFSARNQVFKVNIESRMATHLGAVTGLPQGFTINGAAVNENNEVVVSSAVQLASLFKVNIKTWAATELTSSAIWHSSDLANSNVIISGNKPKGTNIDLITGKNPVDLIGNNKIAVYPNPVTNNQFTVQFTSLDAGNYSIQVTDATGRQVSLQQVVVTGDNQLQQVKLSSSSARGVYLVKVADASGKTVSGTKIVVQ
jgi:hypothetical protein